MTDGQLRVFALVLVLIGLEVWLHWPAVRAWLHPIVSQYGGGTVTLPNVSYQVTPGGTP